MTKLFNPSVETLFAIFEQAGWDRDNGENWIVFASPRKIGDSYFEYAHPAKPFVYKWEEKQYCLKMAKAMENLGLIELAKPDANGWYKVSEVKLVDGRKYLIHNGDENEIPRLARYRTIEDYAYWDGHTWDEEASVFPYFQPLPLPPIKDKL